MSAPWILKTTARGVVGTLGSVLTRSGAVSKSMRKMSRQADHLERTANVYRQEALFTARVCSITNESDTVKRLRLEVPHPDFSFRAGQWVDFFIPGMEKVGGFSVCSSPGLLQRKGVIELAVKYAEHPPAHWIHTKCTVDSRVAVRIGGNFCFDPSPSDSVMDLLLVAGGVGINPLYSILMHTADLLKHPHGYIPGRTHLCYSAKNTEELLFKNSIISVCGEFPDNFSCSFHVTRQSSEVEQELQPYTTSGRISEEVLRHHVDPQRTLCYLCGPPPMIECVCIDLQQVGLPQDRILYEKWW